MHKEDFMQWILKAFGFALLYSQVRSFFFWIAYIKILYSVNFKKNCTWRNFSILDGGNVDVFATVLTYFYVFATLVAKEVVYVLLCVYAAKSQDAIIIFMIFIVRKIYRLFLCAKLFG